MPKIPQQFKRVDLHRVNENAQKYLTYLISERGLKFTGKKVLDMGCGLAFLSKLIAGKGGEVYGVDQDPECIAYAIEVGHLTPKTAFASSLADLPEDLNGTFDIIVASQTLITPFAAWPKVIARMAQLLNPSGSLYLGYTDAMYHADRMARIDGLLEESFGQVKWQKTEDLFLSNEYIFTCSDPRPTLGLQMKNR